MRGNEFLDKMELADPAFVEAADADPKRKKNRWVKWSAAAACFSLVILAGILVFRTMDSSPVVLGGIARKYKNVKVVASESSIDWPWEYKTIPEQYTALIVNGEEFHSRGRAVAPSHVGDFLGRYKVTGWDSYAGKEYQMTAETYGIAGISENKLIAVKLGEEFYVFSRNEYAPPANWGEVLDDYALEQTLSLYQFTEYDGYQEKGSFRLDDDAYIWEVLNACRNAEFVEDDSWNGSNRNYLSFTVTSDALGVYQRAFYVTKDGYIWTNIFDFAYIFRIGQDAAAQILSFAAKNGTASELEPYAASLAGTLAEITDSYILVDDTILCADEKDGMIFKIYLDDLRISRCIDFEKIGVGDVVVVCFTGNIDAQAGNVVEGAYSLEKGIITDGGILIPE